LKVCILATINTVYPQVFCVTVTTLANSIWCVKKQLYGNNYLRFWTYGCDVVYEHLSWKGP